MMTVLRIFVGVCAIFSGGLSRAAADIPAQEDAAEFRDLLADGSLQAWRGYAQVEIGKGWKLTEEGLEYDGAGGGDIATRAEFGDFELQFEWRVGPGGNSGVMYRAALGDEAPYLTGPEYQLLDDGGHPDGRNPATSAGALFALYACEDKTLLPVGQWNTGAVIVRGQNVEHWLNGRRVVQCEIGSTDWKARVESSKFKKWPRFGTLDSGHIVLQDHGNPVSFRRIRIRNLSAD